MTNEEVERAIGFLIEQSAKTDAKVDKLAESVQAMQVQADLDRTEIREAINNLVISNESTRELASQVAKLAIETKRRVDKLEERAS